MNAKVYHVTFRTRVTPLEGQPGRLRVHGDAIRAWLKTAESGDDMTTVNPAGITYDTDVTFTSDTSFNETGTVHLSGSDTLRIHTQQDGLLTPSANSGQLHGAVIWRIVGGTGRFEHATGLITANFVFGPSVGDGIEEQLGVVFSRFGTDKREVLR